MPFESLYIHVPFCDSKCGYCAFYSTPVHDADLRQRYIRRIAEEIAGARSRFAPLRSIYIGGGTPSALTAEELKQLLSLATDATELKPTCEITVEANPESLATEKIAALSESGVTRVSLGIQSFDPTHRRTLQRQGTTDHLDRIVADLAAHGINRLNLDLIYAIPGQSCADFATDLGLALQYRATHVAAYALTIEEQTVLAAQNVQLPDEAEVLRMWHTLDDKLGHAGLRRYEVSNFAVPGEECRHNVAVWHGGTYLGVGPAACSFDGTTRWTNTASVSAWLAGTKPEEDRLAPLERAAEILAFGMRTAAGWHISEFTAITGVTPQEIRGDEIAQLAADGLLYAGQNSLRPTARGLLFNDIVLETLL